MNDHFGKVCYDHVVNGRIQELREMLANRDMIHLDVVQWRNPAECDRTALIIAAMKGNTAMVRLLLQEGSDASAADHWNNDTALTKACYAGHVQVARELVSQHALMLNHETTSNGTALMLACESRSLELLQALLQQQRGILINCQKKRDGETPLMALCSGGHLLMLRALLAYGHGGVDCNLTNKHGCTALMKASQSVTQQQEVLELLLLSEHLDISKQNMNGETALLLACRNKLHGAAAVRCLLQRHRAAGEIGNGHWMNAITTRLGRSALMEACANGCELAAQALLQQQEIDVNMQDKDGCTALMIACKDGHLKIIQLLLQHEDIQLNAQDKNGDTALIMVCSKAGGTASDILTLLLSNGKIDINMQNENGHSALMRCINHGLMDHLLMLLQHVDLDINLQDKEGRTALMIAVRRGEVNMVHYLLSHRRIDAALTNKAGESALSMARKVGATEITALLENSLAQGQQQQ